MSDVPLPDIVDEARRILIAAQQRDVQVRLVGGLAVRLRAYETFHPGLSREYKDIDLVTLRGQTKSAAAFLQDLGYEPSERFNAMNGHERLLFYDVGNGRQLDVFVGLFRMCHEIPINDRVLTDSATIPLAELLLTKLQVVKLNEKDLRDIVAILYHHDVSDSDGDTINADQVAALCARDWGLWRTSKMNVERVREGVSSYDISPMEQAVVEQRLHRLWARIEAQPKSRMWRLRDKIGDRKQWYEDPEEIGG
jgi:hypothetical protein